MDIKHAQERFVSWLAKRMTAAGRGDHDFKLEVEPSGKYWLGRLQSKEAVANSDWGDRGERLEPCAMGIKVLPNDAASWAFNVSGSMRVWEWIKSEKQWIKCPKINFSIDILAQNKIGTQEFGESAIRNVLDEVLRNNGLSARIDVEVSSGHSANHELTISLVNTSPAEHPTFKDTRFYECSLAINGLSTKPFLLESLEDSFRYDRRIYAYGINCGVVETDAGFETEDAVTVDRDRPKYWSLEDIEPSLKFAELAEEPISASMQLVSYLEKWGRAEWSPEALVVSAKAEGWTNEMLEEAKLASKEFDEELLRLKVGIDLLKSNELLLESFKFMNRAMSLSSNDKYDSWRPFQYGFLLANIASIVDQKEEPNTVDVVWFATGGGKTETYLGLLVTAAFYDRLSGKVSGITGWSRFPLRMLSLQQTQRFANAIAAADIVKNDALIEGDRFSLGFFVGQSSTPNRIAEEPKPGEPDYEDLEMPKTYQVLDYCPYCHSRSIEMEFNRKVWCLEHRCQNENCVSYGGSLPVYIVDEEIYRFLPTIVVGTLDKAASIALQASMRGMVGAPIGVCSKSGHGYTYAPRKKRPNGCLVPGCRGSSMPLNMAASKFGPSFRLQDELHLLRDSLGAVDSHYEALYDGLQEELCGRKPKILASSATLSGYKKQVEVLYRRKSRVFPVPPKKVGHGFWTSESEDLMRKFVAIAPRGVTIEYTVDRLLTELQIAIRELIANKESVCKEIGISECHADGLVSIYGTDVVYGNTLRDLEAVVRSVETQVLVNGPINTASLTGKTDFAEVRKTLDRLQNAEETFEERLHIISASSMMSHGVDVDRLNVMVMLGIPLSAAEFIQATARVGRRYPAIVFVVHKIGRERDAGVFRSFKQFVEQGDRFVEPIPVTRRSRRVLDRTIAGIELARVLMLHEASIGQALTTLKPFIQYVNDGHFNTDLEFDAVVRMLGLTEALDMPLRDDLKRWFDSLSHNITIPPTDAKFPSDLSPTGSPMLSLRDVETQVPVIGTRV